MPKPNKEKWKHGDVLVCTSSASCGYSKGSRYIVTEDPHLKVPALKSDDGLYDPLTLLLSTFKKEW